MLSGLVAFRQHLQNLARTKGILELNKQMYEQMGSGEDPSSMRTLGPHANLQNLLDPKLQVSTGSTVTESETPPSSTTPDLTSD